MTDLNLRPLRHSIYGNAVVLLIVCTLSLLARAAPADTEPHAHQEEQGEAATATATQALGDRHSEVLEGEAGAHEDHQKHHPRRRIGAFVTVLGSSPLGNQPGWESLVGVGVFVKYVINHYVVIGLVPHLVQVPGSSDYELPVDLVLEFPIHLRHNIHPFFSFGPGIALGIVRNESNGKWDYRGLGRLVTVTGIKFWVRNGAAVILELNTNYMLTAGPMRGELLTQLQIGGSVGFLYAF